MKRTFLMLMIALSTGSAVYANNSAKNNEHEHTTAMQALLQDLRQKVANAPSGTTYSVKESKDGNIVVISPLGKHTIERCSDGSYSFMGVKAKLITAKNGVYTVRTSLGTWVINTHKGTVTKK